MFGLQLKHVPSIWLFLVGMVIFSLASQTAIRLLGQDGESTQIAETAPVNDQSGVDISSKEHTAVPIVTEPEPTLANDTFGISQIQPEVNQMAPADRLSSELISELKPFTDLSALAIQQQGYGQDEREVAYAFLVHNPNKDLTIAESEFQVIAYDEGGRVVLTDSEFISFILPGQILGIAGNLYLEEDIPIADLMIQIITGKPYFDTAIPNINVQAVKYRPGEYYDRVTGLIAGPNDRDVRDLRVSAIAYDDSGKIIGAGYSFISFIQAGTATGVDVTITNDGVVDRIELFPRLSFSSLDLEKNDRPKNVQDLSFLQSGYVQNDLEVGYGFLVENPNQTFAIEGSDYRMTAFDSDGKVIRVDEGYIDRVLPGQTLGFGSTFFVDEGEEIDSLDLQLKTGSFRKSDLLPVLEPGNITIKGDKFNSVVTGEIMNPYDQSFEDIRVTAIVFDVDNQIVGGGFTWLDFIPADDSSPVEVWVTSVGEPVSAQLYTSVGELLEIE